MDNALFFFFVNALFFFFVNALFFFIVNALFLVDEAFRDEDDAFLDEDEGFFAGFPVGFNGFFFSFSFFGFPKDRLVDEFLRGTYAERLDWLFLEDLLFLEDFEDSFLCDFSLELCPLDFCRLYSRDLLPLLFLSELLSLRIDREPAFRS